MKIITIDGPVASGKSTISRMLAKKLGYYYLYSGALYRALAYLLITTKNYTQEQLHNPDMFDVQACLDAKRLVYHYDAQSQEHIFFDSHDITPYLKSSAIDQGASVVSAYPPVRDEINALLRTIATQFDVVVDGRDAGTIIFPEAFPKFYLTASLAVRAARWREAQKKMGNVFTIEQAEQQLTVRDTRDKERAVAPLIVPEDAIIVDNSHLNAEQTLQKMLRYIK